MKVITTQHIKAHGFPDAGSFKQHFGLAFLRCSTLREHQSGFLRQNNPTRGGHTPEAILKMREARRGKGRGVAGKYERTPEIRQKIADGVLQAWEKGKRGRGRYVYGRKAGRKVWVRSSWEERVLRLLDASNRVASYVVEPFQIPYEFEGQTRRYTPDFLVCFADGFAELWEVKPEELLGHPRNVAKRLALEVFCAERLLNCCLITLARIEEMETAVAGLVVLPAE